MCNRRVWQQILLIIAVYFAATQTPALAADLIVNHRISAVLANEAVAAAVSACEAAGYTESATLVDIDGVPQATLRGDGAGAHTQESASEDQVLIARAGPVLSELSPASIRGTFPGFVYQLGNFLAAANANIQVWLAIHFDGDYGLVLALTVGVMAMMIVILMAFGPEPKRSNIASPRTSQKRPSRAEVHE